MLPGVITVAALSPSVDLMYLVDHLKLGAIHRPAAVRVAGGKSLNLARAAATLGADVAAVAVLGGATGDYIEQELVKAGIGIRSVGSPGETRVCVSVAGADQDGLTEFYPYAPEIPPEVWSAFRTRLAGMIASRPGWLVINGSAPQGLDDSAYAQVVEMSHQSGLKVAVDTHGPVLAAAVDRAPDLVKINRYEAAELVGVDADSADLEALAAVIGERTGGQVIITDGRAGAVGRAADGATHLISLPEALNGRYPVGSGDAFLGGWLAATDIGASPATALRLATGCGTANALLPGPGNLDPETAREVADRCTVRSL
ncbi:1-phosphofructokinase [Microlunatus endophyticus]|uniref:1-phosphofructokinase n=1 Tax=Microlunatus endophyticus TaxID=1716077 RepID=A0A917SAB9_9ACTN|nr:1-phosphofructokinase [Microlunatus endophyticus]